MRYALFIVVSALIFMGCAKSQPAPEAVIQKAVNTTLSGTITSSSGKYFIGGAGQAPTELGSYTVKLEEYVGKNVKVTGQYSGTTLFVDTIQLP